MSDPTQTPPVRPMNDDDYGQGQPVRQARAPRAARPARSSLDHPLRDVAVASVFGAIALWAVPKVLDFAIGGGLFDHGDEEEELELEPDDR